MTSDLEKEEWLFDMMFKLSGVILTKAQMENDFEKVYNQVFVKTITTDFENDMDLLKIFGNVGG
ncbi:MAG: hypothetical protein QXY45_02320 [Candidatus Aenigmatarchaeota archaeon]